MFLSEPEQRNCLAQSSFLDFPTTTTTTNTMCDLLENTIEGTGRVYTVSHNCWQSDTPSAQFPSWLCSWLLSSLFCHYWCLFLDIIFDIMLQLAVIRLTLTGQCYLVVQEQPQWGTSVKWWFPKGPIQVPSELWEDGFPPAEGEDEVELGVWEKK